MMMAAPINSMCASGSGEVMEGAGERARGAAKVMIR
jgi:hypothetical protein